MAKKKAAQRKEAKRELIEPRGDKRYVRRDSAGKFSESDDVGKSMSQDPKRKAMRTTKAGQDDKSNRANETEVGAPMLSSFAPALDAG